MGRNILHRLVLDALKDNVKLFYIVLYITNILDESEYKKNKGTYLLSQVFFTPIFTIHVHCTVKFVETSIGPNCWGAVQG